MPARARTRSNGLLTRVRSTLAGLPHELDSDSMTAVTTVPISPREPGAHKSDRNALVPLQRRRIVVAVRDYPHDRTTIDWALAHAMPGVDTLHLVHAYRPLRLEGCHWAPVVRDRDLRSLAGRSVVSRALQRMAANGSALRADGSAVAGAAEDVLEEISEVADLLVIGDDSTGLSGQRRISWRVQDASQCPTVCVPGTYQATTEPEPVTVVADEQDLDDSLLELGADLAARAGVGLQVSRPWSALHAGRADPAEWIADQQRALDAQLADWQLRHRGLSLRTRIELDDGWAECLRRISSVLVIRTSSAALVRSRPTEPARPCPIATVPR